MSQVSTLPSPSYHTSGPSNSNPRDSPTDPAQLLRQAALSSRKLSRRKLDAGPSGASFSRPLSRSIATTPSISLDYGQEEPLSTPETPQQPSAPAPFRAPTPSSPPRAAVQRDGSSGAASGTPLDDDASMREEGEISESEDPPFRPPLKSITAVTGAAYANFKLEASGSAQSSPFSVLSRSPSEKAEDAYQHATPPITTPVGRAYIEAEPAALSTRTASESFRLETPLYVLDPDHVRPRLSLTQKQYDTAKEVILDILGYGVPPEYLIDCGLSKEIIYYVFTELNLRLPSNLDTAGIPPYPPPPDVIASILRPQSGYPLSPSATPGPTAESDITRPGSVGHLNLSPRASVPHGESTSATAPQPATTVSVNGSLSASVLALSESTLTAIEQQRKQELLARKAVQASRKRKESVSLSVTQALAPSTSTASTGADISAKSAVSAVSVEDFLNSIGPPLSDTADPNGDPDQVKAPGLMKQSSPEPMSIDEAIPGFGRSTVSEYDQPWSSVNRESVPPPSESTSFPRSASASERSPSVEREKELPTHRASQALDNPPTRSRSNGLPASHFAKDNERDSRRSSTTPQPTAPIPRRGTKRPVAADFDSEPMSKAHTPPVLSRTGSGAGFSNGATYHPNPHVRRKMNGVTAGGFASLNNARRCVIDVSDSEDEAREDETPSTASAPGVSQASARDSALALELEIERMRKMIREREEIKLRKQAMASSRSTPVSRESPVMSRAFEGEISEVAVSTSTCRTRDEISGSETGPDKASENVLAIASAPSSPRLDVNRPSPISSTPSPPASPPLSPFQDNSNAKVAVPTPLTDQSATPADGDQAIGGPALAAEYRQESAASSRASTPLYSTGPALYRHPPETGPERECVDIAASSQIPNGLLQVMADSSFTAYNSVLSHYPFLSGRSLGPQEVVADMPDLERLRMQAAARRMTNYGLKNTRICQFELPGGGECRDSACGDMHLSVLRVEPNDEETARYLCGDQNVAQMVQALQAARTRRPEATFDERMKEVWANIRGRRMQATTSDDKT